jgi:hypothetical protein
MEEVDTFLRDQVAKKQWITTRMLFLRSGDIDIWMN